MIKESKVGTYSSFLLTMLLRKFPKIKQALYRIIKLEYRAILHSGAARILKQAGDIHKVSPIHLSRKTRKQQIREGRNKREKTTHCTYNEQLPINL